MFGLLLAVGMSLAPTPAGRSELAMPADYRWALLAGLEHRLGGKFIIVGLEDAQGDCDRQQSCATPAAIDGHARFNPNGTSDIDVFGKSPVAVVSIVDAKRGQDLLTVRLAVFDPVTRKVTQKVARVASMTAGYSYSKQLRSLSDAK